MIGSWICSHPKIQGEHYFRFFVLEGCCQSFLQLNKNINGRTIVAAVKAIFQWWSQNLCICFIFNRLTLTCNCMNTLAYPVFLEDGGGVGWLKDPIFGDPSVQFKSSTINFRCNLVCSVSIWTYLWFTQTPLRTYQSGNQSVKQLTSFPVSKAEITLFCYWISFKVSLSLEYALPKGFLLIDPLFCFFGPWCYPYMDYLSHLHIFSLL